MPTYEYACSACGHRFEEFQSIKAPPVKKCPKCKKNKVQRLISSGASFIFKGSGFYITDYRSDKYKSDAKADSAPKTDTPAKDSATKSETPAAPAATDSKSAPAKPAAPEKPAHKPKGKHTK